MHFELKRLLLTPPEGTTIEDICTEPAGRLMLDRLSQKMMTELLMNFEVQDLQED